MTGPYPVDPETAEVARVSVGRVYDDPVQARLDLEQAVLAVAVDTAGVVVDDHVIPGPPGAPPVAVRVYRPAAPGEGESSALLYIHGGGFYRGSIQSEHGRCVELARELVTTVVSVGYRLAPEDPYPAAVEDCYAALVWLHGNQELGIDRLRIAVHGASAGGGIAAGLALLARDRGGPTLCFQYLGIPELDHRLATQSMRAFTDTPTWIRAAAERSWEWYLRGHDGPVPPYASPAVATDLAGLPRAYISAMEFDPLRDEAIEYAQRLVQAGVSVELHLFPGTFHGSSMATKARVTMREQAERIAVLRRALEPPPPPID